jgi:electron transfer flavoprotein beta subunit
MNIVVCIKQVLCPESDLTVTDDGRDFRVVGSSEYQMNRFDEVAVETALRLAEALPEAHIQLVTVGPERAAEVLKRGMGMGAHDAAHILTDGRAPGCARETAGLLAAWLSGREVDLVLCGAMSEDQMEGITGPTLAGLLGIPAVSAVIAAAFGPDGRLVVEREMEGGRRIRLAVAPPVLLAIQPGIFRPRYPALSKMLRANRRPMEIIAARELSSVDGGLYTEGFALPDNSREGRELTGSTADKAAELLAVFKNRGLLKTA